MGYRITEKALDTVLGSLSEEFIVLAPKRFKDGGRFSDADIVRYGEIHSASEIVYDEKSADSFKEALLPASQTLFYFTEKQVKEADAPAKGVIVFLRSCDIHAVKRLDEIYQRNGGGDYYYRQHREKVRFVLMGCPKSFETCFCADMGTNRTEDYDLSIEPNGDGYYIDCKNDQWQSLLEEHKEETLDVVPSYVSNTAVSVNIPEGLSADVGTSQMWDEYDGRCIDCGRCNFACPTCTCFTMQDIFYSDNGRAGERRRVWASCMVSGFTDVAGGESYRKKNGQRMRFKVLHKVLDYKQRFGYHMCVGCGRCDDVCPEYISFSHIINRLADAVEEVQNNV